MKIIVIGFMLIIPSFCFSASVSTEYYQFNTSEAFAGNTIFEKKGNEFTPIVGAWSENAFKERSEGEGFDSVKKLGTTFEEVMKVNPYYKQRGAILPKNINYGIHGDPQIKHIEQIMNIMDRVKSTKRYEFNFTNDFDTTLDGKRIIHNSDTNPKYKAIKDKSSDYLIGGSSGKYKDGFEIKLNPKTPNFYHVLAHEVGHTLFDDCRLDENLFTTNRTFGNYRSFENMGVDIISKKETVADHFADYINYNKVYRERYLQESKFFDKFIDIIEKTYYN